MNLVDLDVLDSEMVEQDNPFVTIKMDGEEIVMIPLEYLYSLPIIQPKTAMLDMIRAEIEGLKPNNPNFKGYFQQNVALDKALGVIDKYKAGDK